MQYTKIVKLASGNVQLQNASDNPVKTLQPAANLELLPDDAGVRIKQWQGENTDILISQVAFTRLDPAADVAFAGTAQDLMTLLGDSFFFELEGSSGLASAYPSGSYHMFANSFGTIQANFVIAPNVIEGFVTEIKYPCELEAARIRVQVAAAGNAVVGLAKYNIDTGLFELIAQSDPSSPFNLGSATTQEVSYALPVTFEAGIYANLIWGDSAATIYNVQRFAASTYFGYNANIGTTSDQMSLSEALAYTGTFPDSMTLAIGHRAGSLLPFLLHKVV
jgi:hypothetical protein